MHSPSTLTTFDVTKHYSLSLMHILTQVATYIIIIISITNINGVETTAKILTKPTTRII